jgi:hypothetical protein
MTVVAMSLPLNRTHRASGAACVHAFSAGTDVDFIADRNGRQDLSTAGSVLIGRVLLKPGDSSGGRFEHESWREFSLRASIVWQEERFEREARILQDPFAPNAMAKKTDLQARDAHAAFYFPNKLTPPLSPV